MAERPDVVRHRNPDRLPACEKCGFPVWAPGRTRHHACDPASLSAQTIPFVQPTLFDQDAEPAEPRHGEDCRCTRCNLAAVDRIVNDLADGS